MPPEFVLYLLIPLNGKEDIQNNCVIQNAGERNCLKMSTG